MFLQLPGLLNDFPAVRVQRNLFADLSVFAVEFPPDLLLVFIEPGGVFRVGGINAFTTIIGRCITLARVHYYNSSGHSIPDKAKCVRTEVPGNTAYPGAKLILTLPVTPEPIHISEQMVSDMQSEYKSYFPKMSARKQVNTNNETAETSETSADCKDNPCMVKYK